MEVGHAPKTEGRLRSDGRLIIEGEQVMRERLKEDIFVLHLFLPAFRIAVFLVIGALGGSGAYIGKEDKAEGNQRYQYHHPYVVSSLHQDRLSIDGPWPIDRGPFIRRSYI